MVLLKVLKSATSTSALLNTVKHQDGRLVLGFCYCQQLHFKRYAGHSKWSNIKFKKMHKDNARAKVFGQLSREIIQAVKGFVISYNLIFSLLCMIAELF